MRDTKSSSARLSELSWLNVLFCLMVVFIHVASYPVSTLDQSGWKFLAILIPQKLAFVAVFGFFFLSGLKTFLPTDRPVSLGTYYRRRARTVLLPYLIAVCVYYPVIVSWGWEEFDLVRLLRYCLVGDLASHFYFVVILVQFILLLPLWRRMVERYDPVLVLPFALLITVLSSRYLAPFLSLFFPGYNFPYADRVFPTYLVHYLAGCCAGREYGKFLALLKKNRRLIRALFCCFTLAAVALTILSYTSQVQIYYLDEIYLGYQLSGILFLFDLAATRRGKPVPGLVRAIDRVSYLIYLYHGLVLLVVQRYLIQYGVQWISVLFVLQSIATYCITIPACLLWRLLAEKIKKALPWRGPR